MSISDYLGDEQREAAREREDREMSLALARKAVTDFVPKARSLFEQARAHGLRLYRDLDMGYDEPECYQVPVGPYNVDDPNSGIMHVYLHHTGYVTHGFASKYSGFDSAVSTVAFRGDMLLPGLAIRGGTLVMVSPYHGSLEEAEQLDQYIAKDLARQVARFT